jgi:hypothetical protein
MRQDLWLEWTMERTHVGDLLGIPATHRQVKLLGCSHFTLANGLITHDLVYFDFATMLRQLGLLPEFESQSALTAGAEGTCRCSGTEKRVLTPTRRRRRLSGKSERASGMFSNSG